MQVSDYPYVDECVECGFDVRLGSLFDAIRTVSHAKDLVDLACDSLPAHLLDEHPADSSPSIADQIEGLVKLMGSARRMVGSVIMVVDSGASSSLEPVTEPLKREAALTSSVFRKLTPGELEAPVPDANTGHETVGMVVCHLAHAVLHLQADIARIRGLLGDSPEVGMGEVVQISGSGGGLPKTPLLSAHVDKSGVVGDRQATRRHHGAPFQALCLFSAEVIDEFAAQGHPITYGSAGENITIRGLDWAGLRAGIVIEIGNVTCRLTAPAVPCSQNLPWFTDGDFSRLSHTKHPGHSRWYAAVVEGGTIDAGDAVRQRSND